MIKGLILLIMFFALVFLKVPIGISMVASSAIAVLLFKLGPLTIIGTAFFNGLYATAILALPFYIFAGNVMTRGGIAKKLCDMVGSIFERFTGGYGMVTVIASAFFAAISGSASATTASMGSMMVPEMEKHGYKQDFALAIAAAGGVIGPIIPPSVIFVLYGVATQTSIADLFVGGIIPGVLIAVALCVMVFFLSRGKGIQKGKAYSFVEIIKGIWYAKWALLVPIIILGGIYGGIFTPTEAGAVAGVYAVIISLFVEKTLNFKGLIKVAIESAVTSAALLFVCGAATAFGRVMTLLKVPQNLTAAILSVSESKLVVLILINIALLLIGCVMDSGAAIIILAPLLAPVAAQFAINPVHFGVILCVNVAIGAITPPIGSCLFAASIIGDTPYSKLCKAVVPFVITEVICLILLNAIPALSTCLL